MDSSVGFLLENLKQLVAYQTNLIEGSKTELEKLNVELEEFKIILEEASTLFKKDKFFERWESQIREAVYDIEDIIDTCITRATAAGEKRRKLSDKWFLKLFNIKDTINLAEAVKNIREKTVKPLMAQFEKERHKFSIADASDHALIVANRRQEKTQHIVGLKEEAESFVNMLIRESDKMEISSIIGMAGLGKTTFAWKIFEDSTIKFKFPILIWVNISEKLNVRKVLLDILLKFTREKPDASVTDDEIIKAVKHHLEEEKFLIVMDDIWKISVWKELQAILPKKNNRGRVLITTRNTDVGNYASTQEAYNLRFLNATESWELLRYKVFGRLDHDVPNELEGVGKEIVSDCNGLPLSIVIIGGILEEKTFRSCKNNTPAIKNEWEEVRGCVKKYLVEEGTNGLLRSVISLSYVELPYELKNCFLYLGVFPEDSDIPVKKLIRLWVAEGLIHDTRGSRMEEVAHNYLKDLIRRNLVMVRKAKLDGEARICHIHDSIREICKREGEKLNLFQEISKSEVHPEVKKIRRLCIHSHALVFFSEKPKLPKARSFLCFNESPMTLEAGDITSITDAFGLLRVYEAEYMKFRKFPPKLVQQLTHLRYLTLAVADATFTSLPEIVTDLWNLQSLMVDTPSHTLEMKGDIWKMRHLRHFKTRASIILKKKIGEDGKKLQTLSRLSPESCTAEVCQKAKALLTLGVQGDLRTLSDSKCLSELESLNKLKLEHVVSNGAAEDSLTRLPDSNRFPPKLKILVLCGTRLDWGMMSIISALAKLEVLKLKQNAFHGNSWEATGSGFTHLLWLHIERADLKHWKVSNDHFPILRILQLNNCEKLSEIPCTLGKSLELLSLRRVSTDAVISAKNIVKEQAEKLKRVVKLEIAVTDRNLC